MTDAPDIRQARLTTGNFWEADDPFALFGAWLADAAASEPADPNAMAVATADRDGLPDVRMLLLKGFDQNGFVFYTNLESPKARQLRDNPKAALCFHWKSLGRQVRLRGPVAPVQAGEADEYYASRPRPSRIGAWASRQSAPLADRRELEEAVAAMEAKFPGEAIPRPDFWSGFRLRPSAIEFWRDGAFRLHDRVRFTRCGEGSWRRERLFP